VLNLWRDLINGSITVSKTKNMFSSLKLVKIQHFWGELNTYNERHVFIFNNKIVFLAALKTRHFCVMEMRTLTLYDSYSTLLLLVLQLHVVDLVVNGSINSPPSISFIKTTLYHVA